MGTNRVECGACVGLLLATGLATAAAQTPPPTPLQLEFSLATGDQACPEKAEEALEIERLDRARAVSRVTYSDTIDVTAHVEQTVPELVVLGRVVRTGLADIHGGGTDAIRPGALIRVRGRGRPDGSILAEQIDLQPVLRPDQENELKTEVEKFSGKFWEKHKEYHDPQLESYLNDIVHRLIPSYVPTPDSHFQLHVVADPDLNAFALPDGTVVVHSGLIARMENEAQLAAVLGHEMAHAVQRHAVRAMSRSTEHQIVGWGSLLASVLLGVTGSADTAQGVQLMSSAWLSGYSRNLEDEADSVGLRYLYLAGYDVRQAPLVWQTFQMLYKDPTREQNFFYGSHSTGRDREHNLEHEVWKYYEPQRLVGGRVAREEFLRRTAVLVRENAMLDLERGNLAWAEWGLAKSLAVEPDDPATHVAFGRLTLRRDGAEGLPTAIDAYRHAVLLDPGYAEAYRELGHALRRAGELGEAETAFEKYLELRPDAPDTAAIRHLCDELRSAG